MRVLIIEPDEYYQRQYAEAFGLLGDLLLCKRAGEAQAFLEESQPDVMVTELLLPDFSGYQLLSEIQERYRKIFPVIIYSQISNLEDIQESLNLGVAGYFVKGQDSILDVKKLVLTLSNNH